LILGSSIVLLPSFEARAAATSLKADPQIVIQTRRPSRRNYRSYNRWRNRWNDRRNERSYWRSQNRYYNRGRMVTRTRVSRNGYTTVYRTRTRVRRNY
jgi:hypothetical protein